METSVVAAQRVRMEDWERADLDWFFGVAQALFERSTFGAMLERQKNLAFDTTACGSCKGSGFSGDDSCPRCRGCGFAPVQRKGEYRRHAEPRACPPCRGATGRDCEVCGGEGYIEGWSTHVPSGVGDFTHSYEMIEMHAPLMRHARVGRHLDRLRMLDETSARVLAAFHSDRGARWGRTEKPGRIFVVYPLTKAGRTLLRMSENRSNEALELTPDDRLWVEWQVQLSQPKDIRRLLFSKADAEARGLHASAEAHWVQTR